jgi:HJR/Mrr/RecB family endonuclease
VQASWYRKEKAAAWAVIEGAKHSIDFLAPAPSESGYGNSAARLLKNYVHDAAPSLSTRVVLLTDPHTIAPGSRLAELYERSDLRFLEYSTRAGFAVVDRATAIIVNSDEEDTGGFLAIDTNPDQTESFQSFFDSAWEASAQGGSRILFEQILVAGSPKDERSIITFSEETWTRLVTDLNRNPAELHALSPRRFEELIAHLLMQQGCSVQLTAQTRDGGKDVLVATHSRFGDLLYLVECKHHRPCNPVGVSIVRQLYGVVEQERATAGLLITTSSFTEDARKFREPIKHRITLHDFNAVAEWVNMLPSREAK